MDITLIRPPIYTKGFQSAHRVPYLGVAYIGAMARKMGHRVDIVDMCGEDIDRVERVGNRYLSYGMPFSELKHRLKPSDVFGFSCSFSQDWVFNRELIRYIRKLFPKSIFVAGGEQITALPDYCMTDCPDLDVCVRGEGDITFTKLLEALLEKRDLSEIPGLTFRSPDRKDLLSTPTANRLQDIDDLPYPAWDLIPMENYLSRRLNYHIDRGRTIPIMMSRGCPYQCSFCSNPTMWGNRWTPRNPARVADEIDHFTKIFKADNFIFSDLTSTVNQNNLSQFCEELLARSRHITWQIPFSRTESFDETTLRLMYDAGCRDLDFAVESGSPELLKTVKKGNDPRRMTALIKRSLSIGFNCTAIVIIGLPQENGKTALQTFALTLKLALLGLHEIIVTLFTPYPGSQLFRDLLNQKKITLNDDYFLNLFSITDISQSTSWSEHFSPRCLRALRILLIGCFYATMLLSHPNRLLRLIINILDGTSPSRLSMIGRRILTNLKGYLSPARATVGPIPDRD
ncbi:MAG TPA: radical SAM protein [Elusimicrobiota bacterium]|nr:radical SAM protein [Elusimicrobiota bacterium]